MIRQDDIQLEECFDAACQFMGFLDEAGRIIRVDRAVLKFTGLAQANVTGLGIERFHECDDSPGERYMIRTGVPLKKEEGTALHVAREENKK